MKNFSLIVCLALLSLVTGCSSPGAKDSIRESDYSHPIRVACVGDSITYGFGFKNREQDSYPAQLGGLLGPKWIVKNFGVNGATALKEGSRPYSQQQAYRDALEFKPDVVVVKLGTNDTAERNWANHKEKFAADYFDLIQSFRSLENKPRIYLCRPVPLFRDRNKAYDTDKILVEEIIPQINEIAKKNGLPVIDLYAPFEGKAAMFPDGVHPDANGTWIMAKEVYAKLLGQSHTHSHKH